MGVDFDYLLGQVKLESGFNVNVKVGMLSVLGLYQFIDQSWLFVVKKYGVEYGMVWVVDSIIQNVSGCLSVGDVGIKVVIFVLCNDFNVVLLMVVEFVLDNKDLFEGMFGCLVLGIDLYMVYFMGFGGVIKFLKMMQFNFDVSGVVLFFVVVCVNYNVFYDLNGQVCFVLQIYDCFVDKFGSVVVSVIIIGGGVNYVVQVFDMDGSMVIIGGNESVDDVFVWVSMVMGWFIGIIGIVIVSVSLMWLMLDIVWLVYMMFVWLGG